MNGSQFEDAYQGRYFKVTFYNHENGYTADLKIDGFPLISDDDNLWVDREEAKAAMVKLAHKMIDKQR